MGILPQLHTSAFKALHHHRDQPQKRLTHKTSNSSSSRSAAVSPIETPLPKDVQQLKETILASHPTKLVRFSFSHMRHVATPPVTLPANVSNARAVSMIVAGKSVPFTKCMHAKAKKKAAKRHMNMIDEYVQY